MALDEGFHEIQLNGKQLVFLFMATTVVAVVIFLGGVMVGRGVRLEKAAQAGAEEGVSVAGDLRAGDPTPPPTETAPGSPSGPAGGRVDDLSYYSRLGKDTPTPPTLQPPPDAPPERAAAPPATPPAEAQKPTSPPAETEKPTVPPPAPQKPAAAAPPAAAAKAAGRPAPAVTTPPPAAPPPPASAAVSEGEWAVQVLASEQQGEAEALASRLKGKNYPVFVVPPSGTMKYYRVRVGKYAARRDADAVARRLQKEEGLKPWVTR